MTHHVEVDRREVVRYLLGDATCGKNRLGIFSALLPVPIHIPELDRI